MKKKKLKQTNASVHLIQYLFKIREGSPKNVEPAPHPLLPLLDHLYLLHYKPLPTALLDTHHLTCGICSLYS